MKKSNKIVLICLCFVLSVVVGINIFLLKSDETNIKLFTEISNSMSKNLNQLRSTSGITLTALASDPSKKLYKIGINFDEKSITSKQLKEAIEVYIQSSVSSMDEKNWESIMKPYDLRIEELSTGSLLGEKQIGSTEIIWASLN